MAGAADMATRIGKSRKPPPTDPLPPATADEGYVTAPSLEGAAPLHAAFDLARGLVSTGPAAPYDSTTGAFRFVCGGKGRLAYDDPLVFPNQSGKAHLHQSWGNAAFSAATTVDSLAGEPATNCNVTPYSLNRSAYWMPALVNDQAEAIEPDLVVVYYKQPAMTSAACTAGSDAFMGTCITLPNKIRFLFGWNSSQPTARVQGASWYCTGSGGGHFRNLDEVFANGCRAGDTLVANTVAPECWDGKYLDTPDHRAHMAYSYYTSLGRSTCPASHRFLIPQQENKAMWRVTEDMYRQGPDGIVRARIGLASDAMLPGAKPGETLHADYMEGWVWEAKKLWFDHCIQKRLSCNGGDLGNGTGLIGADRPSYGWLNPNPRVNLSAIG